MSRVSVRLHAGKVQLAFQGDESMFDRTVGPLLFRAAGGRARTRSREGAASGASPDATPGSPTPASAAEVAVRYRPSIQRFGTFTRQLDPEKNGAESRIAAFAFFLWNYERKEVFREDEVAGCFLAGGSELPDDAAPLYESLESQRVLARGEKRGTWRLTQKGQAHVRHHLLSA